MKSEPIGIIPEVHHDAASAIACLEQSGAVRLSGVGPTERDARAAAESLFGDCIRALPPAARVFEGGEKDRKIDGGDPTAVMPAHTDGFGYGDNYPDYIALSCVQAADVGGESFLLNGYALHDALLADPATRDLAVELSKREIDLTEAGMQPCIAPIIRATQAGRRMVRRTLDVSPTADDPDPSRARALIQLWEAAIDNATPNLPRFRLAPGEALFIDNYRLLHGRDGYYDPQRMLWRVWIWTQACLDVPDQPLHSDTRYALA